MKMLSQFSLRELLLLILSAGVAVATLRAGGILAPATIMLMMLATMCSGIVAFVGRCRLRAAAMGFLVPVAMYSAIVWASGLRELDPYDGRLPTSRSLAPLFEALATRTWRDAITGEIDPDYDPAIVLRGGFGGGPPMVLHESPDRSSFMVLGHVLVAACLGYIGSKFAVGVHCWQNVDDEECEGSG
jgi:hypothetical protein